MKNQLLFGAIAASVAAIGCGATQAQALDLNLANCDYSDPSTCTGTTNSGTAIFTAENFDYSSGTGVFNPFLGLQNNDAERNDPLQIEQGLNTSQNGILDNKEGGFTKDVLLGDVAKVTEGGIDYRLFYLDLNEGNGNAAPGANAPITLSDLRIYIGNNTLQNLLSAAQLDALEHQNNTPDPDAGSLLDSYAASLGGLDKIFDMDMQVLLYDQNSGSGRADLTVKIAESYFNGYAPNNYMYFYSKFTSADGGFEEWSYRQATPDPDPDPVPTPAAVLPILGGLFGAASRRKKGESTEA